MAKQPVYVRQLTDDERVALTAGLRAGKAFVLRRCQILLASANGKRASQIAAELACDTDTALNAINAFNTYGMEALKAGSTWPKVIRRAFDESQSEQLRALLHKSPRQLGHETSRWTLALAAQIGDWLVVADGEVYVGVHILEPSQLGRQAPILVEHGPLGELWLTIYNYQGAAKRFWEYASLRGAFWQGNIRAGCIMEVGARNEYASAIAFWHHLRSATIQDTVDADHVRTVRYCNGGDELSLRYDLWQTQPDGRQYNGKAYTAPNLQSPVAVQGDSGLLRAGNAMLVTAAQQMLLIAQEADPEKRCWVAVNVLGLPTPLRLETPCGVVTADTWGLGRLELRAPIAGPSELIIESVDELLNLRVPDKVVVVRK